MQQNSLAACVVMALMGEIHQATDVDPPLLGWYQPRVESDIDSSLKFAW